MSEASGDAVAHHPAYNGEEGTADFGRLWSSVTFKRVLKTTGAMGATIYVCQLPSGGFRVRKHNSNGAYCWERDLSQERARLIVERCVEEFGSSIEIDDRESLWPSKSSGYGGGR